MNERNRFSLYIAGLLLLGMVTCSSYVVAASGGDIAPRSKPDGKLSVADLVLLEKFVLGHLTATPEEISRSDVAPVTMPDGKLDVADILILQRMLFDQSLSAAKTVALAAPVQLDDPSLTTPTSLNPFPLTGSAPAGSSVRIYVNNTLQETITNAPATFSIDVALFDGVNTLYATTWNGTQESERSNSVSIEYANNLNHNITALTIDEDTVWTPGTIPAPYVITEGLTINNGATLTIHEETNIHINAGNLTIANGGRMVVRAGAVLRFAADQQLNVTGVLDVQGRPDNLVSLTALADSPVPGFWKGILINGGPQSMLIKHALVEYAHYGLWFFASGNRGQVTHSTLTRNLYGIFLQGSPFNSAQGPQPLIQDNSLVNNLRFHVSVTNYVESSNERTAVKLNRNWWGSDRISYIKNKIFDLEDRRENDPYGEGNSIRFRPYVDFSGFLAAPGGEPVLTNDVIGPLGILTAGQRYQLLGAAWVKPGEIITLPVGTQLEVGSEKLIVYSGAELIVQNGAQIDVAGADVFIANGAQLTLQPGATMRFGKGRKLDIYGGMNAVGEPGNQVLFSGLGDTPIPGSWEGIQVNDSNSNEQIIIEHAQIEYAHYGVLFNASGSRGQLTNSLLTRNLYGLLLRGSPFNSAHGPQPLVQNNSLVNNERYHVSVTSYVESSNERTAVKLNRNWWGSDKISHIKDRIFDLEDKREDDLYGESNSIRFRPYVDFSGFLAAPGGEPVSTNDIIGSLGNLAAGQSYRLLGAGWVGVGQAASLAAGTQLEIVDGTLSIDAQATLDVHENAQINLPGGDLIISANGRLAMQPGSILRFGKGHQLLVYGDLEIQGTAANKVLITAFGLSPEPGDWQGITINGVNGRVNIDHAVIEYADNGLWFFVSAAVGSLTNSTVRYNQYGLRLQGDTNRVANDPHPHIQNNRLVNNERYNIWTINYNQSTSKRTLVNLQGNWWGSDNINAIKNTIFDAHDIAGADAYGVQNSERYRPYVDFSGFLAQPNGLPASVSILAGEIATDVTLNKQTNYVLLRNLTVAPGGSLTVPAGARIIALDRAVISVAGKFLVQGSIDEYVTFTSYDRASSGDWGGIKVAAGGEAIIEYAIIEHADRGIEFRESGNLGRLSHSLVHKNNTGIHLEYNASPTIASNRVVYNTVRGLYMLGIRSNDARSPQPSVMNNDIYANKVYADNYGTTALQLDMSNNWWGSINPQHGDVTGGNSQQVILISPTTVTAALQAPYLADATQNYLYFSPNNDQSQDTLQLAGTLTEASDWILTVYNYNTNVPVYSATGTTNDVFSLVWDGLNQSGALVEEAQYRVVLNATVTGRTGLAAQFYTTVDVTAPSALIQTPASGSVLQNVVSQLIAGEANDLNFSSYHIEYGGGAEPIEWVLLKNSMSPYTGYEWIVGSTTGGTSLENGEYTVRLTANDQAGNTSTDRVQITLDNITVTDVSTASPIVDTGKNESLAVNFLLNLPSNIILKIYSIKDGITGDPVRTITQFFNAGMNTIFWNGTNELGALLATGDYIYTLEANDGARIGSYALTNNNALNRITPCAAGCPYNSFTNDQWKETVTLNETMRVLFMIELNDQPSSFPLGNDGKGAIFPAGTHTLTWDGIDDRLGGIHVNAGFTSVLLQTQPLVNNEFHLGNSMSEVAITGQAAWINVKADPYLVYLSYGQFTRIVYHLQTPPGENAEVEIKLFPPKVNDYNHESAIVVVQELQAAGDHAVTWTGINQGDSNGLTRTISDQEGGYTFAIKAKYNNFEVLSRGVLHVYQ